MISRRRREAPVQDETNLSDEELSQIRHFIPGPEPTLVPITEEMKGGPVGRTLSVADTLLVGNELRYLTACVETNWISSAGSFVKQFESQFAAAMGCEFGVACSSGTAALHLALAALGVGPDDEIIIPTFTMIATANAVAYTGATPVLVDSEPITWNMDPALVAARITARTRGIVVMHTYGHPVDMDAIGRLADARGLWILEDAAEAHGARYRGRATGSLGIAGCFSFYANKIITTGEGGMVTTNDEKLARVMRRLRDHAFSDERHFWHKYVGFNYRMTNLQAAVGVAQTERLADLVEIRRVNARRYSERLRGIRGLTLPVESPGTTNVFWMYGVLVEEAFGCSRDELRERLARRGIETRTFFIPIHLQPIYYRAHRGQRYQVAEALCRKGMYLPSGATLSEADVDYVVESLANA
jgi:perosamine synthetase